MELPTIADRTWATGSWWNDGKSEISFYDGWIESASGRRTFTLATQLTKHNFDRQKESKSDAGIPSFKWTMFYETISGSEQFKHSYVANLAQADLQPLKVSANRFDWCSNQYRELSFLENLQVRVLWRSDDYGNSDRTVDFQRLTYPAVAVPFLVRSVDFSRMKQVDFSVILMDGVHVDAMVEVTGTENVNGTEGERIVVHYAHAIDSTFGTQVDKEVFWRGLDPARTLLKVEALNRSYGLALVESVRSAYWQENVFDRLSHVKAHP